MALNLNVVQPKINKPKITIFGIGGAGGNAINNMIRLKLEGVDFVAANTDAQALENSLAENKIQLGTSITKGLGAGSFPDRGRAAAEENIAEIESFLEDNNMIFIAAGMGGGTGTGAAPVIAKLARERDILTVGVVTKPFHFEGRYRMETAQAGIEELRKHVDTLVVIPNQNLFRVANEHTTFESAFKMADDVLYAGVRGITDLITMPGLVNLDFADIRTIMTKMGKAMMGTGEAEGENRAVEASEAAIANPLLDDISIRGAKGVLVNMTGGSDMTLFEADMAVNTIKREVDHNANIIFGSAFDENMTGRIRISIVATGIDEDEYRRDNFKVAIEKRVQPSVVASTKIKEEIVAKKHHQEIEENDDYSDDDNDDEGSVDDSDDENFSNPPEKIAEKKSEDGASKFNFFGFMGSKKRASKPEAHNYYDQEEQEKYNEEDRQKERYEARPESKRSEPKRVEPKRVEPRKIERQNYEQQIQQKNKITQESSEEAMRKKQEFFGGRKTVFDKEDGDVATDSHDDIINVPAFFRRKKR